MKGHWALAVILVMVACGGSAVPPRPPLDSPIVILDNGDTVAMTEQARLGVLDGVEEYQLADLLWMVAARDGGVYLVDVTGGTVSGVIRKFDAAGRFVRWIGAKGEGPGEYIDFPSATVLRDGSLLVTEQGPGRITVFDTAGRFVRMTRASGSMVDQFPATDGGWYVSSVTGYHTYPRPITYYRYAVDGSLVDSVPAPDVYHDGPWAGGFEPRAMTIILPDGRMVTSTTDSIAFTIHGAEAVQRVARRSDRARFPEEERADRMRALAAAARGRPNPAPPASIPELKMAYWYLVSDPWGRILFLRNGESYRLTDTTDLAPDALRWSSRAEVDIFDSTGTYLGRLVAPRNVSRRVVAFGEHDVWLVHIGTDGVPQVVRWQPERVVW